MKHIVKNIHFVGIGGAGMSGIAEVLLNLGYRVTGSDLGTSAATQRLASLGATVMQACDLSRDPVPVERARPAGALAQAGAEVDVVLTRSAREFIGAVTFEALTGRPVHTELVAEGHALDHIKLARSAELILVAPTTAVPMSNATRRILSDMRPFLAPAAARSGEIGVLGRPRRRAGAEEPQVTITGVGDLVPRPRWDEDGVAHGDHPVLAGDLHPRRARQNVIHLQLLRRRLR